MYTHTFKYIYIYIYIYIYTHICIYISLCMHSYRYTHVHHTLVYTFLHLRAVCRSAIHGTTACMVQRMQLYKRGMDGTEQILRLWESGFLRQNLLSFAADPRRRCLQSYVLILGEQTGLPACMAHDHFDKVIKRYGRLGWHNGKLNL